MRTRAEKELVLSKDSMPTYESSNSRLPNDPTRFPNDPERRKRIRTMKKDMERLLARAAGKPVPEEPLSGYVSPGKDEIKIEDTKQSQKPGKPRFFLKAPFVLLIAGLLVLVLGGGGYFWYLQKKNTGPVKPPATEEPPSEELSPQQRTPEPIPLFPVDETDVLTLTETQDFLPQSQEILRQSYPPDSLRRILGAIKDKNTFLTLGETLDALRLSIPPVILAQFENNYIVAFHAGPSGINSPIFAVEFKPERSYSSLREEFRMWEPSLEKDLATLLRLTGRKGEPANGQFLDNTYKGVSIRYLNFSDPTISLDYALIPEKALVIITTSRESMYMVIDKVFAKP